MLFCCAGRKERQILGECTQFQHQRIDPLIGWIEHDKTNRLIKWSLLSGADTENHRT